MNLYTFLQTHVTNFIVVIVNTDARLIQMPDISTHNIINKF